MYIIILFYFLLLLLLLLNVRFVRLCPRHLTDSKHTHTHTHTQAGLDWFQALMHVTRVHLPSAPPPYRWHTSLRCITESSGPFLVCSRGPPTHLHSSRLELPALSLSLSLFEPRHGAFYSAVVVVCASVCVSVRSVCVLGLPASLHTSCYLCFGKGRFGAWFLLLLLLLLLFFVSFFLLFVFFFFFFSGSLSAVVITP